ncbi:hypothetical protein PAMP_018955 [Pampus punctatissimus]
MAPSARPSNTGLDMEEDESYYGIQKGDRKTRKPLVEKKRRARINESLQELRTLLADTDVSTARTRRTSYSPVPVMLRVDLGSDGASFVVSTVSFQDGERRGSGDDGEKGGGHIEEPNPSREASERFAAGYIQCMHEVHMFVSSCPGIDATVAAELLNHLLECMPLNEDHLQDVLMDLITDTSGSSTWHGGGEALCATLASPGGRSVSSSSSSALSPAPSTTSSEDLCSDLDETDSEHNQSSTEGLENREALSMPTITYPRSMWRPW